MGVDATSRPRTGSRPSDSTSRLAARVAVALLVFAAAFATRSFYVEDLIRAERASRKRAGFHDALANATQKFTYDYEQRALRILRGGGVLYTGEQPPRELEIAHPPGYAVFMAAGRRQDLAVFLLVPLSYLVFQSLLHTEYRYGLPVHYFLFPVMGFGIAGSATWLRTRRAA